ncbi:MobF family relaxase [Burkholderia gladioli]|uniref:MobF family relaxase n=1 Tax=Burkholderia gladioli TaxID=28095 RepID=UPI00163E1B76|nr:MobF family relaxase [Burkholderia gladioli]
MLSITKINSSRNQANSARGGDYLFYLGSPSVKERSDFAKYVSGSPGLGAPPPFWAGAGAPLLGLRCEALAEHVDRLARGFHPLTNEPLVKGAGDAHVTGLDMTFSAPKDFSVVFAAAATATRAELVQCLQDAARAALAYASSAAITRHERGGRTKRVAEATIAACYTHFSSRALDPQLHVHALQFNLGKRLGADEWSALEQRPQFERKMATGALFRAELAWRLRGMGFNVIAEGPYFQIEGISDKQRDALSTRSKEIDDYLKQRGVESAADPVAREIAALNTRSAKAEPPLPELLKRFEDQTAALGLDALSVEQMRRRRDEAASPERDGSQTGPFEIDGSELLAELTSRQSCATEQEALAAICAKAMGRASASDCLRELDRLLSSENIVLLGRTEMLSQVFTSKARLAQEAAISERVRDGAASRAHAVAPALVAREFDALESELSAKLGVPVSLTQQRAAAFHIACETGRHAFVEGWAGTGKTTMLAATTRAYAAAGFEVVGCCQSAAAAQNLARETGARSRTIASLLLAIGSGRLTLNARSILVLDEAGMVGSREFSLLQDAAMSAGAKLVCVGDPKQLQPVEAGGIFASLMREHGKAELSDIQRQRTDFAPLLDWIDARARTGDGISRERALALRQVPEDARMAAVELMCAKSPKLARAFERWRARFDHQWLRDAVRLFAAGGARPALDLLDARGRLRIAASASEAASRMAKEWAADKTPLADKAMLAGTRAEVAELNRLARAGLVAACAVREELGVEALVFNRDGETAVKRFAPGDRLVFLKNDLALGVANGATGTIVSIHAGAGGPRFAVELDAPNAKAETAVAVPARFSYFDHAYCLTNHKAQGRTFSAVYALANPLMADREWTYVATSRSRFATTLFVDASALGLVDPETHREVADKAATREAVLEALAVRMSRSRAKGTTLDFVRDRGFEQGKGQDREPCLAAPFGDHRSSMASRLSPSAALNRERIPGAGASGPARSATPPSAHRARTTSLGAITAGVRRLLDQCRRRLQRGAPTVPSALRPALAREGNPAPQTNPTRGGSTPNLSREMDRPVR